MLYDQGDSSYYDNYDNDNQYGADADFNWSSTDETSDSLDSSDSSFDFESDDGNIYGHVDFEEDLYAATVQGLEKEHSVKKRDYSSEDGSESGLYGELYEMGDDIISALVRKVFVCD